MNREAIDRNPYTPDMGARPPFLAGRERELEYYDEMLAQLGAGGTQKHLVLVGLRGVGKTVLLNEFEARCETMGWKGETAELWEGASVGHLLARSTRKALLQMSVARRAGDAVRRGLAALKAFTITLGEASLRIDVDPIPGLADSGDLADDLRDLLLSVGEAAQQNGTGFALILDEMHCLTQRDLEALIVALHRTKQKALPIALVAGGLPLLPELTGNAKSYAERGFEFRDIGALGREAAIDALEKPAAAQGVSWDRAATERVVELTEGYPYFVQEYGREIWRLRSDSEITPREVAAAEPLVLEYLDESFFSQRIGKLPAGDRQYMVAMAALGDGPQSTRAVAERMGKTPEAVTGIRSRLIGAGLIYASERGAVDFTVPLCAAHLRRRYEADGE